MKLSLSTSVLLAALASAAPQRNNGNGNGNNNNNNGGSNQAGIQNGNNDVNNPGTVDSAAAALMTTAIGAWMRDTGLVSNFLNNGASYPDDATFKNQALIARSAEIDELTSKNVLDQFMPNNQNVKAANATLSNGSFQLVVDELGNMADNGRSQMAAIQKINNVRCVNVLPNIDTYMREAALTIGNGQAVVQSVRPSACGVSMLSSGP
jgi:hypothetical protein